MIKVMNIESKFELDRKEKINIKLMSGFLPLDEMEDGKELEIKNLIKLDCFMEGNEAAANDELRKDKEYSVYVLHLCDNSLVSTSSDTFYEDVKAMFDEIEDGEFIRIKLNKIQSKNYNGHFFRASLVEILG